MARLLQLAQIALRKADMDMVHGIFETIRLYEVEEGPPETLHGFNSLEGILVQCQLFLRPEGTTEQITYQREIHMLKQTGDIMFQRAERVFQKWRNANGGIFYLRWELC